MEIKMEKLESAPIGIDPYFQGRRSNMEDKNPYVDETSDFIRWNFGHEDMKKEKLKSN